jgi:hypothetical protein
MRTLDFNYPSSEWVINYQGGFVRRGFAGEVFFHLRHWFGFNLNDTAMFFSLFCYGLLFIFTFLCLIKVKHTNLFLLIIYSPFLLRFQIIERIQVGFRKEIVFLALLAILAWLSLLRSKNLFYYFFVFFLISFPFLILMHEILILFFPYILILYQVKIERNPLSSPLILTFGLLSCLSFIACLIYSGTDQQVIAICDSLGDEYVNHALNGNDCVEFGGAITFLKASTQDGIDLVSKSIENDNYIRRYIHCIWLSAIAYLPLTREIKEIISRWQFITLIGLSILATIIIGMVAVDWGRFLYIHLASLFFVFIGMQRKVQYSFRERLYILFRAVRKSSQTTYGFLSTVLVVLINITFTWLYATAWYLPHCCTVDPEGDYLLIHLIS